MSTEKYNEIKNAMKAIPGFIERGHNKTIPVKQPSYEVLYVGRELDGNRWRSVWQVNIFGSRSDLPDAEARIMVATTMASEALLPIRHVLLSDFNRNDNFPVVDPEIGQAAALGQAMFTLATCTVRES